jgi:hypothetical protein
VGWSIKTLSGMRDSAMVYHDKLFLRVLAVAFQQFSLNVGNKITFCFSIKKTHDNSLIFPYVN